MYKINIKKDLPGCASLRGVGGPADNIIALSHTIRQTFLFFLSMRFQKPCLTIDQQITLLKERGLSILDEEKARESLQYIGYYRLSAYFKFYQNPDDSYLSGTSFVDILNLYVFDRKLKLHFFDAIERIEIALRTLIILELSALHRPFWYADKSLFHPKFDFNAHMSFVQERIDKSKHKTLFIQRFYEKYTAEKFPPSWMMMEILTFGEVIHIYKNLQRPYRKLVADRFKIDESILISWFSGLAIIRNICAHHERLWNKNLRPPKSLKGLPIQQENPKVYNFILVVIKFLETISPHSDWKNEVNALLENYPSIPKRSVGFPEGKQSLE